MLNLVLGILQFIVIGIICIWEVKQKSSASFLWATLMIMFGIMHLISVLVAGGSYSEKILWKASLFAIVFSLLYFATRLILSRKICCFNRKTFEEISKNKEVDEKYSIYYLIFFLTSIGISLRLIIRAGGVMNTSWSSGREIGLNESYVNIHFIFNILYFALGGLFCCALVNGKKAKTAFTFFCILVVVLIGRDRMAVLPILTGIIALVLFKIRRIKIKTIFFAMIAAVVVIFIVYGLRAYRWYGTIGNMLEQFKMSDFIEQIITFIKTDNGELGLRNYFYHFIENNNNFHGFGKGHTYIRMFLVYIPTRFSFGVKPTDFAQTMASAVGRGIGSSIHPTLFGDCYANLGMYGIFLGVLWGIIATIGDYLTLKFKSGGLKILAFILLSSMYVMIARGAVYNAFVKIAYGIPVLYFLQYLKKIKITYRKTYKQRKDRWNECEVQESIK
ncbi:MAG: oligosaccharide repeat unit polymerase [Lachnospiraceae bacterium]|nr:oligosaccharide repeat unit polymerase [Lachnospiraceae bacterium]